ncbi:MAG: NUDIX hydrolase, partial [Thermomonas sp.]
MGNTKEILYEGDWLRLVKIGHWESCERTHGEGMAVIIIAVTPNDDVLFVEQFRVPLGARTIEMPAGLVGDDHAHDTLEDAARRELIEETGWSPGKVEVLLVGPTSSGMSNERIAFVRAREL